MVCSWWFILITVRNLTCVQLSVGVPRCVYVCGCAHGCGYAENDRGVKIETHHQNPSLPFYSSLII